MPSPFVVDDFEAVRVSVLKQLQGMAAMTPMVELFITPANLHYIFAQYVERVERETGFALDNDTHSLDTFSRLVFELVWDGMCHYDVKRHGETRLDMAARCAQWDEESIEALVFAALKEWRKKANYLRRRRDPMYGKRMWDPITVVHPRVSRTENSFRWNYSQIGANHYKHPVIDEA